MIVFALYNSSLYSDACGSGKTVHFHPFHLKPWILEGMLLNLSSDHVKCKLKVGWTDLFHSALSVSQGLLLIVAKWTEHWLFKWDVCNNGQLNFA